MKRMNDMLRACVSLQRRCMLRCVFSLVCCLLTAPALAQDYFNLTAPQVRIDSVLPEFTHFFPLASYDAGQTYSVSILYPEFIPMSAVRQREF